MFLILLVSGYIAVYITFLSIPAAEVYDEALPASSIVGYNPRENDLFLFIQKNLAGKDGEIITNVQKYDGSTDTLSESIGLMMNYSVLSDKRDVFDKEFAFLKKQQLTDDQFIRWRVGSRKADSNASIDDLRIIRALLDAYDRWGDRKYYDMAGNLQLNMFKKQVKERDLDELYDWKSGKSKHTTPLCYLDLYTIDRISEFNLKWLAVEDRALSVILNGRLGDDSPFFYKYYDYSTGTYSLDEEYKKNKGICLTYTLYTALHLAEVNEDTGFLAEWLKRRIAEGKLYAWYDPATQKPVSELESTAVYALAAIYAEKAGEKELALQLTDKMMKFMVTDRTSPYYGGFGTPEIKYFHSFDNLTALWALKATGN